MKSLHLWLLASLFLGTPVDLAVAKTPLGWFRPVRSLKTVFRAQSDEAVPTPPSVPGGTEAGASGNSAGTTNQPLLDLPPENTWNAFSPPMTSDPFLDEGNLQPYVPGAPMAPAYGVPGYGGVGCDPCQRGIQSPYSTYGANGGRPYRFGWEQRMDTSIIPGANVSGGGANGELDEVGVNYDLVNTSPFVPGWILRKTLQFRWRAWDGPVGGTGLPGSGFRFGEDFEVQTPGGGPYTASFGITPSINTDFNRNMTSNAFQLDGRGIIWWQLDPCWSLGLGAMYWDRVDNRVLPYGGLVYRDDFWEWRITYPEGEVRLFLGNEPMWSKWLYFRSRYNIEAYEGVTNGSVQGEFEIEDWQLTLGFQMDAGYYRWFLEGGLVLDREIDYDLAPRVSLDTSYIARVGIRY